MREERLVDTMSKLLGVLGDALVHMSEILEEHKVELVKENGSAFARSKTTKVNLGGKKEFIDPLRATLGLSTTKPRGKTAAGEKKFHYAYHFFQKEMSSVVKANPDMCQESNISSTIARLWRELPDKTKYQAMEEQSRKEYNDWVEEEEQKKLVMDHVKQDGPSSERGKFLKKHPINDTRFFSGKIKKDNYSENLFPEDDADQRYLE
ncbi:MAG: uncharacterized protein A8A55_0384 [Amphiamblys sp. WSBS2006]|nr:MAG: uncharacterized protein A8A55_0384 [Amphiamblys sp. WSBS2006]